MEQRAEEKQERHAPCAMPYADLLGKRFAYGGRGPFEYDCYGLCMELYRRLGRELPDFGSAVQMHVINGMVDEHRQFFAESSKPEPWCLVLFRIHPRYVTHIGVVLEDCNRFIHILKNTSVCIERLDSPIWNKKIAGFLKLNDE
jgi:cell wall-associated NlpC family hydrolase